ncbi:Glycine/D-amino acid oxidase [Lentibacillus halodurans]|uniref:Glycine/D-amino acid oxidase n=1 Tax=Lentibacillus halodurans TaxID=237679 RepID=A0A1I0VHB2_9BACI|nr:FAD-dependent oxidoreductase [Lentibacillus halodurans]SFA74966.1 Glycine/D-amino acid oxidase [Lentibacillus halodurans]
MANSVNIPQFPQAFWRDSVSLPDFPKLNESIRTEVAIVGGGITGITAAYLLTRQGMKVTLIDASDLLNGVTGHTTAKITAQHGIIYDELIQHFGKDKASLYYQACMDAKQLIEDTIQTHQIDCDHRQEDAYIFTNSDSYVSQLETEKKAYEQLDIPSELTSSVPLDIPVKSGLRMDNQAQFHPLKYLKVLVDEAVKNGLDIYEQTTAVDIEYNKHPTIVTREEHRINCNYVIQASHYPFYDGEGFYPTRMYPERSYIVAVKTSETYPGGMYINAESPTRSVRSTNMNGEDLWLISGENHKTGQGKSTMKHYEALQQYAEKQFGISEFVYRWSAQDLTTMDKVPYIGPVTKNEDNVFVATGYRKWGMTNGTIAAKIISDRILDEDNPYAELYVPSRFQADPDVRKFTSMNADVAKHMIRGKLEYTNDNVKDLSADDATVTRVNGKRTGVYKDQDHQLYAVDTTCKHLGCEVNWNSGDRTWDCPCHGSRYSYTGEVIEGPAKEPLNKVELE